MCEERDLTLQGDEVVAGLPGAVSPSVQCVACRQGNAKDGGRRSTQGQGEITNITNTTSRALCRQLRYKGVEV